MEQICTFWGTFRHIFAPFWHSSDSDSSDSDSSHYDLSYAGLFLAPAQGTELLPRHFLAVVTVIVGTVIVVTVTGVNMT